MSKIRCLIVDDEPPAVELLDSYCSMIDQLRVVGMSHSALNAFELLKEHEIDLLFLDIQMPVLNGLDFIKALKNPPAIILTTAYREYALDGYDLDIIDYLLKPIAFDRFLKAIDRYQSRLATPATDAVVQTIVERDQPKHIFFNVNRTYHKVQLDDILYIESLKDYVCVHTSTSRLVVKGNLGSMMKKLPAKQFVRIHRSYAVATQHVQTFNQTEVDVKGKLIPIGPSYREGLLEKLK